MVAEKYNINIFRARPITIVDGNKTVTTAEQTPALIKKAAGIEVFEEDTTTLSNLIIWRVDGANTDEKLTERRWLILCFMVKNHSYTC